MTMTRDLERTKKFEEMNLRVMPLWAPRWVALPGNMDIVFVRAWSGRAKLFQQKKKAICIRSSLERSKFRIRKVDKGITQPWKGNGRMRESRQILIPSILRFRESEMASRHSHATIARYGVVSALQSPRRVPCQHCLDRPEDVHVFATPLCCTAIMRTG